MTRPMPLSEAHNHHWRHVMSKTKIAKIRPPRDKENMKSSGDIHNSFILYTINFSCFFRFLISKITFSSIQYGNRITGFIESHQQTFKTKLLPAMPVDASGNWVPAVLADLSFEQNASWQAYLAEIRQCDRRAHVKSGFGDLMAGIFLTLYTLSVLLELVTLPAAWRLAKRPNAGAFLIMFHIVSL